MTQATYPGMDVERSPFVAPSTPAHQNTVERLEKMTLQDKDEPDDKLLEMRQPRPHTPQHSADGGNPYLQTSQYQPPRNRSPYSRPSTLRPQSSSSSLSAPPMARAHSSPTFTSPQFIFPPTARSQSPLRSPKRVRSPFRPTLEEPYPVSSASGSALSITDIESISEDAELDITPRPVAPIPLEPSPILSAHHGNTFPRTRRRPASPLHQVSSALSTPTSTSTSTSTSSFGSHSPLLSATRFNEAFPSDLPYTRSFSSSSFSSVHSASVPSTPTSARSRSPSISSLETIPDTPDAEEAAIEAERIERLKRATEGGTDTLRRGSLDGERGRGFGARDKRKRWSVCGAEKRSDLNLETIWED
jgi:hypothetical protein